MQMGTDEGRMEAPRQVDADADVDEADGVSAEARDGRRDVRRGGTSRRASLGSLKGPARSSSR